MKIEREMTYACVPTEVMVAVSSNMEHFYSESIRYNYSFSRHTVSFRS